MPQKTIMANVKSVPKIDANRRITMYNELRAPQNVQPSRIVQEDGSIRVRRPALHEARLKGDL